MDFYLTEEWKDGRNYSALFADDSLVEYEPDSCEEQRTARTARNMLAIPGDRQERRARRLAARELVEDTLAGTQFAENFKPAKGDQVKYTTTWPEGGPFTTYTATIESINVDEVSGAEMYNIKYEDESTHMVNRATKLETLSSMPQPARRFVEFGHDELKLIWEPDVHITNLHQAMLTHEEVRSLYSPYPCGSQAQPSATLPTARSCSACTRTDTSSSSGSCGPSSTCTRSCKSARPPGPRVIKAPPHPRKATARDSDLPQSYPLCSRLEREGPGPHTAWSKRVGRRHSFRHLCPCRPPERYSYARDPHCLALAQHQAHHHSQAPDDERPRAGARQEMVSK